MIYVKTFCILYNNVKGLIIDGSAKMMLLEMQETLNLTMEMQKKDDEK
jgi:hypothetical protein